MRFVIFILLIAQALPAFADSVPECGKFTVYLEDLKITSGGNSIGDVAVGHVTVFSENDQMIGMQNVTTLIAPDSGEGETQLIVNAYLTIDGNQLIYSGSYPSPTNPDTVPHFETQLAVVGGTGVFQGANGQVSFFEKDAKRAAAFDIECLG
ncbi:MULTISPECIES: hypothetical protein [unclassified Ruegeria]|uniref:hypothetical protein n=1 Tax=unclassified Ruegeria TaxID=2625375 RepID=UPI00148894DF|nr:MULTISPECIES: hypothetical protein [unclassified Ruegeria]